jgi:two-component system, NtrC family, nitrogen regulation sensor histidine kinase GlnL
VDGVTTPALDKPKLIPVPSDVIAAMPVAMLLIAPDNHIADANVRAETLLNIARSSMIGQMIGHVVRTVDAVSRFDIWHSEQPLAAYDIEFHAGRAPTIKADVMIAPVPNHAGWRIITIHGQSQAEKIGVRRNAGGTRSAMGAAAILAHEIKNPLSGIRGAAQLMETSESNRGLTQLICNEVDRIAALIDRMQDFTTERHLECRAENIYPLLDRAAQVAAAGFANKVRIDRNFDPSLPAVHCNGDALVQIMINLLKNAAEALEGSKNPNIRISTAFRHGVSVMLGQGKGSAILPIEILVTDNGPGVPEHIQDDLFNPFISSKRDGQGLGLALVDKLVRDMNGFVQYVRDEKVKESVFRILLPMGKK